jgi:N-acetylglucosaminyl-diphospho-decaprenol L-rhamnosyltransferase
VKKAVAALGAGEAEVFVVDNQSSDGSVTYLPIKFPWVQFIFNKENLGFSKANNQVLNQCKGKYILFLNPDTILPEDCFTKVILQLESLPKAGACGVRMIDGGGRYLRESKRGFPSPWASFCKMSGLTGLFPRSRLFAKYYLGHLEEKKIQSVDILSGAFMLIKKEVLEKTGGFDEQFFMYAEDIDLSYRIRKAGYLNYYVPAITLIHFKGESTKRDDQYLKLFYQAMSRFSRKYTRSTDRFFFGFFIQGAIKARASMDTFVQSIKKNKTQTKLVQGPILLYGDPENTRRLKAFLLSSGRPLVETRDQAIEIIFCEGAEFSFAQIIESIQQWPAGVRYKYHASGSACITGSDQKDSRGEVIFIPNF